MARLAEYLAALAALLGHENSVHFVRLDPGSIQLVHKVDQEEENNVVMRLDTLRQERGTADVVKAYRRLDDMLAVDNAIGTLIADYQALVIRFPGRTGIKPLDYGTMSQRGCLDGIPIKVGGLGETVPIHLQEIGPATLVHHCLASRGIARAIAVHLFNSPIRVYGAERWRRETGGAWALIRFTIDDFEVLDDAPLGTVVARLRAIPGNHWREIEHPLEALRGLRDERDCARSW
jgi:hypothetical protein